MKSEIQQVLKELSLESFAIIIGSLLNLNSRPSLFNWKSAFLEMCKHATEESQLWNCKLQPRPSSQRPWGPTLGACCCNFKITCHLWLGWLGVGDIGAVVNFGRIANIWNITIMSFESQNQNLCNNRYLRVLGWLGGEVRRLGQLSRSNANPPISNIGTLVMIEKG